MNNMQSERKQRVNIDHNRLRELIDSGASIKGAARILGVSPTTVRNRCRQFGLFSQWSRHYGTNAEDVAALVAEGLSADAVAERLGVTKMTIMHICRKYGIKAPWQKGLKREPSHKPRKGRVYYEIVLDGRTAAFRDIRRRDAVYNYIVGKGLQVWKSASAFASETHDHLPASAVYRLFT